MTRTSYATLYYDAMEENKALQTRVAELEAQLAAQAWRPMENVPDGEDVELLVHGYIGDDGLWYYRDGTTPLKGWRPID